MPDLSTLIDYCISVGNKSGAIIPAPQGLKKLKESIEGVPFQLLVPGMSGVLSNGNLLQGIQQLAQQLGGLQNLGGQFQQILGQMASGQVSVQQLVNAAGGVTSLTAGLMNYLGASDLASITSIAPGTQNTSFNAANVSPTINTTVTTTGSTVYVQGPPGPQGPAATIPAAGNGSVLFVVGNTVEGDLGFTFDDTQNNVSIANTLTVGRSINISGNNVAISLRTRTVLSSGNGTYTAPTGCQAINIRLVGAGGGGSGTGNTPGVGSAGGNTTFGSLNGQGGGGGSTLNDYIGQGGSASGGDINIAGGSGYLISLGNASTTYYGGPGGQSFFGGAGVTQYTALGLAGAAGSGGGGAAGAFTSGDVTGAGGGAGGYCEKLISNPTSYSYNVGAGGAGGTAGVGGNAGGAGGSGSIIIDEYY